MKSKREAAQQMKAVNSTEREKGSQMGKDSDDFVDMQMWLALPLSLRH